MKQEIRTQQKIMEGKAHLFDVIVSGDVSHLNYLLDYEADVNVVGKDGRSALHVAADLGNAAMCSLLIRHGADVNIQTHTGLTPLFFASRRNLQVVQVLIQSGCEVTLCSYNDDTPLHAASASGHDDIIAELISSGCDVNAENCDGSTPLFLAIESGSRHAVKTLIKCGADPNTVLTAPSKDNVLKNLELSLTGLVSRSDVCQRLPRPTVAEIRGQGKSGGVHDQVAYRKDGRSSAASHRHASGQPQCQLTRRAKMSVCRHHGHGYSHRVEPQPQRQPYLHQHERQHWQQVLSAVGCHEKTDQHGGQREHDRGQREKYREQTEQHRPQTDQHRGQTEQHRPQTDYQHRPQTDYQHRSQTDYQHRPQTDYQHRPQTDCQYRSQTDCVAYEPQVDPRYDVWQKRSPNSEDHEFEANCQSHKQVNPHVKRLQGNSSGHRHPQRLDFVFDEFHEVDFGFAQLQVHPRDRRRRSAGDDTQLELYHSQGEHTNADSIEDHEPFINLTVPLSKSDVNPLVHAATCAVKRIGGSTNTGDDLAVRGFALQHHGQYHQRWYRCNLDRCRSDLFANAVGIDLMQRRRDKTNPREHATGNSAGVCKHTGVNKAPRARQPLEEVNPLAIGSGFVAMIPAGTATDNRSVESQGNPPHISLCNSDDNSHYSSSQENTNRDIGSGPARHSERPARQYLFGGGKHVVPGDEDVAKQTFSTRSKPDYVTSWLRKRCQKEGFGELTQEENSIVGRSSFDGSDLPNLESGAESSCEYLAHGAGSRVTTPNDTALSQLTIKSDATEDVTPEKRVSSHRRKTLFSVRSYVDKNLRLKIQGVKEEQPEYSVLQEVDSLLDVSRCYRKVSTGKGITPLHRAAQLGMESVSSVLLDAGADVNAVTETGESPMHFAALYSSISGHGEATCLLRLLLKAGADLKAVTRTGETPLHFAALVGDALTTAILISAGADVKAADLRGNVPLHKVCGRVVVPESNRVRTARLLLAAKSDPNTRNTDGLAPLHVLLENRESSVDLDLLHELLSGGADPNLVNLESLSYPLMSALHLSQMEYARVLVQKGAQPNVSDQDGRTPMHLACAHGDVKLFQLLLAKGCDPRKRDRHGFSPLRCAVTSGREAMVRTCIASGVSTWQVRQLSVSHDDLDEKRRICLLAIGGPPSSFNSIDSPFCSAFCAGDSVSMNLLLASGSVPLRELYHVSGFCEFINADDVSKKHKEAIAVVREASQSPPSLQNFCRWEISHLIGCRVNRKSRAQVLGLPAMLRDLVLFLDLS